MKQQFVELLSDIGFVREGIVARDVERAARSGGDGVSDVTGEEVGAGALFEKIFLKLVCLVQTLIEGTSVVLSIFEGEMSRIWYQNDR